MPRVIIESDPLRDVEFSFEQPIMLGRGNSADFAINYPGVSRQHARIEKKGRHWTINDLGSSNGTFVEGRRVEQTGRLRNGERFSLGKLDLRFYEEEKPPVNVQISDDSLDVLRSLDAREAVDLDAIDTAEALRDISKRLKLVNDIGKALSAHIEEEELLPSILEKLFEALPQAEQGCILVQPEDSTAGLTPAVSRTRKGGDDSFAISRSLVGDVVEKKRGFLTVDATKDERFAASQTVQNLSIRSVICVPMIVGDDVVGAVYVTGGSRRPFTEGDMSLLVGIAGQAGLAISNTRMHRKLLKRQMLEQDLALARRIQRDFLPLATPKVDGWEFWNQYDSALEVGGDYYGYFDLPDGRIGVAIGDVSGKGISAALYMARLSSEMRIAVAYLSDPAAILERVNDRLCTGAEEGMFVTAAILAIDRDSRRVQIASAGHPAPLVVRRKKVEAFESPSGTPLGVMDDSTYETAEMTLDSHEVLFLFTDGVTEAMNPRNEEYSYERLRAALGAAGRTPSEVGEAIEKEVREWYGTAMQNDDLTLVAFGPVQER